MDNLTEKGVRYLLAILALFILVSHAQADENGLRKHSDAIIRNNASWIARENAISLLPKEEKAKLLGLNKHALPQESAKLGTIRTAASVSTPASLDYRSLNAVTSVKNQAACGSCWAFAATAAIESQILMRNHILTDLSEQVLVSCSGAGNCVTGGNVGSASGYIQNTGLPSESCFPYTATDSNCSPLCADWNTSTHKISDYDYVTTAAVTVNALKTALAAYGPLATTMEVYDDFYYYSGGIYSKTSDTHEGAHAILLVGYSDAEQAFILKNSWGTDWGESGYFRVAYSQVLNEVAFGQYTIAYNMTLPPPSSDSSPIRGRNFEIKGTDDTPSGPIRGRNFEIQ